MKLTIELDPIADRVLFDRVMAACIDLPAPVTMTSDTPSEEMSKETETAPEEMSKDTSEEMSEGPRVYGEPGPGRKRRSKAEKTMDDEIDALAAETNMALRTDCPAEELLAEMKQAKEDDAAEETKTEENFEMETEEESAPEEMSAEEFRATVIGFNKKHGKAAISILSEYGSGLSKISSDKYAEVIKRLKDLDDA